MPKGRPFFHNVDYEELRGMIKIGFTLEECENYYNIPYQTLQYYARKFKLGKFKAAKKPGKYDEEIIHLIDVEKYSKNKTAKTLGTSQPNVVKRYKIIKEWEKREKEKEKWMKSKKATVDAAVKN